MGKNNRKTSENARKADQRSKGMEITHEQVSDGYTEGTIDGKIDRTNENDALISHDGERLSREGFKKK